MKFRLALAVLLLAAAPAVAGPMCGDEQKLSTSVCGEGQIWDGEARACVDANA